MSSGHAYAAGLGAGDMHGQQRSRDDTGAPQPHRPLAVPGAGARAANRSRSPALAQSDDFVPLSRRQPDMRLASVAISEFSISDLIGGIQAEPVPPMPAHPAVRASPLGQADVADQHDAPLLAPKARRLTNHSQAMNDMVDEAPPYAAFTGAPAVDDMYKQPLPAQAGSPGPAPSYFTDLEHSNSGADHGLVDDRHGASTRIPDKFDLDDEEPPKRRWRLSAGCWILIGFFGTVLAALGVVAYFFWPRPAVFTVTGTFNGDFTTIANTIQGDGGYLFNTSFFMNFTIRNPNKYDVSIDHVTLTTKLLVTQNNVVGKSYFRGKSALSALDTQHDLGIGQRGYIPLPAGSTVSNVMAHQINFYTASDPSQDAGLYELIQGCGLAADVGSHDLSATYTAKMDMGMLDKFSGGSSSSGTFKFRCSPSLGNSIKTTFGNALQL
nr:hypothetical protein HK105_001867 [Polyrhizophydium stewartii]